MSLFFWIALGTTLAALLIRWILRSRLREEQAWKKFVDSNAPPYVFQSKDRRDTDPQGEGMNTSTPMPTSRSPHDGDLRRSSRIERPVPLLILGTNRRGETFQEKTSAVSVNLHGCRYPSRHDYAPESWVTLQVTGTDGGNSPVVRARVRSVLSPQTPREFCQVGVELEIPGNVWGIPAQPEDWQRILVASNSGARAAAAVTPALEDPSTPLSSFLGKQSAPPERRSEVTVFPGPPSAAAPAAEVAPAKEPEATKAARVVITLERLLQALQGRIQLAADKAVQTSLSTQLDEAVKITLANIEDGWRANVRQSEEFSAARLAEAQNLWEKELVVYRSRAEEISRRLEALAGNSQQTLSETQKFVESFANETAPKLHARLNASFDRAIGEFEGRAAQVSGRHLTQIAEGTQLAAREARSQLIESIAEVHSLLSSAGGGVSQERVESLIDSSREQILSRLEERLGELHTGFEQQHDVARKRTDEIARQLEGLAAEASQAHSQHEQALSEVHSLLANMNAGVPQERLDSLLSSSRAQTLSHPEWRLAEVLGHDELAKQVEKPSTETRDYLAEIRSLIDRASREIRPQDLTAIEQSVGQATKEIEHAPHGVPAHKLAALMEPMHAASQEFARAHALLLLHQLRELTEQKQA